ncbi:isopropylmalate/homocitrate/citramalate synthase [Xanthomonas vasicola]|uniref:Uncharacterized protein n=1 Tax=Xanthomonas vasicola pv. vasculorum NCPPB 890 TaxID=1184265 RepID=A0A836P1T6_XANVA|nr:ketosteroid isomerase-related protein [Xanthomonas vasicola]AZR25462.1 isopropylmalate/homocitrate/citramalate synthase [Xanthomonas vasicola pv. arecae]AZR33428.1 isopropylmalate/homocitrate/citramalate synthase [Xanthomonas vasicola]KEZ94755.1 hypothetical protein A11M_0125500 [Xanthomonas vasicola pv. vasculorum NCPPB 895]KFA27072.1 hypothetical protein KWG_0122520 [Xanthomonas vasicola pv. vasculorum NCPPB 1381]KFA29494.1 hypothetical protein KW5_0107320 [Xanthomonas vasicola pv. vascul
MSESNRQHAIGLVQAYYAAFNRGDWDGMVVFLADDVAHDLNQGAREIGRAEFTAFLQRMNDSYREQLRDVVVIANDDGTRVGAEYVVHGVYHTTDEGLPEATGQTYVLPGGAFFDVQGDKITRVTNYYNLQEWIAQVSR